MRPGITAIILEQKTADGQAIRWALESSGPIRLLEASGFSKTSFKPGDVVEACISKEALSALSH